MTVSLAKEEEVHTSSDNKTTQFKRDPWSDRHDRNKSETQNPNAT